MRRSSLIAALAAVSVLTLAGPLVAQASAATSHRPLLLARGGGHFGGGHFGGSGLGGSRSGRGLFSGRRSILGSSRTRRGLLRRIARALALAYIFHLLFSHGGLSILVWIAIVGLLVMLWRWRRRRRYAY